MICTNGGDAWADGACQPYVKLSAILCTSADLIYKMRKMQMIKIVFSFVIALSAHAHAESFEDRARLGKTAEVTEAFKQYQNVMHAQVGEYFASTMRTCFDKTTKPELDTFVLVADIFQNGKAQAVEVKPATNIAKCFAEGFSKGKFPTPPTYPNRKGFPVTMETQIAP